MVNSYICNEKNQDRVIVHHDILARLREDDHAARAKGANLFQTVIINCMYSYKKGVESKKISPALTFRCIFQNYIENILLLAENASGETY